MLDPARNREKSKALVFVWLLSAFGIVCLSAFGRSLQYWVFESFGKDVVAILIGICLIGLGASAIFWQSRRHGAANTHRLLLMGVILVILVAVITLSLPRIEERLHFITFGVFGFLSKRLLPVWIALLVVVAWSAFDELFQAWLPDRVGDLNDVVLNIVARIIGIWFACVNTASNKSESAKD